MHEWRQRASWLATDHKLGWSHSRPHSVQRREGCRSRRRRRGAGVVKGAALAVWNRAGAHKKEAAPQSMDSDGCQYAEAVGTCLDNIDSGSGGPPSRCRQGTGPALGSGRPRLSAGCRRIARARRRVTRPVTVSRTSLCRHSSESAHRALPESPGSGGGGGKATAPRASSKTSQKDGGQHPGSNSGSSKHVSTSSRQGRSKSPQRQKAKGSPPVHHQEPGARGAHPLRNIVQMTSPTRTA